MVAQVLLAKELRQESFIHRCRIPHQSSRSVNGADRSMYADPFGNPLFPVLLVRPLGTCWPHPPKHPPYALIAMFSRMHSHPHAKHSDSGTLRNRGEEHMLGLYQRIVGVE